MNYLNINKSILEGKNFTKGVNKDIAFYKYLLDNGVAYFFSKRISNTKNRYEKEIIKKGDYLNNKYIKTLKVIDQISKENKIPYLLFKTYKYIDEVVDGDIDLFVKNKDFNKFMNLMINAGFDSFETEKNKGVCTKKGYCKIEPRINISFHGYLIIDEKMIWKKTEIVKVNKINVRKVLNEIDLSYYLLNILYGPNYLRLYSYVLFKDLNLNSFNHYLKKRNYKDIELVYKKLIKQSEINNRFPLFLSPCSYIAWWRKSILMNDSISFYLKIKHVVFYFYSLLNYVFLGKLVFKHDWGVNF